MGTYIDRDELLELYANTDELDISNYLHSKRRVEKIYSRAIVKKYD